MADDSDKILKILIQLGVIGQQDAKAAKDLLGETKDAAQDLSGSMPENWKGMEKYKEALKGAGEGAEGMGEHIHHLRALMSGAGPAAQELGHLLHFALNPAMLFGASAAAAMEAWFKHLEKVQEKYHEILELSQKVNDSVREVINSGKTADEQFVEFTKTIAEAHAAASGLGQQIKNDMEFAERANEAATAMAGAIADAHKTATDTTADIITMLETMGRLTPEQSKLAKDAAEHQQKMQAFQDERQKLLVDVNNKQGNVDQLQRDRNGAGSLEDAKTEAQRAEEEAQRAESVITKWKDINTKLNAAIGAVDADEKSSTIDFAQRGRDLELKESLLKQQQDLKGVYESAKASLPGYEANRAAADKKFTDLQEAEKKIQDAEKERDEARQKLKDFDATEGAKMAAEIVQAAVKATTDRIKGGESAGDIFNKGIEAMFQLDHMKSQTGFSPAEVMQRGSPGQKAYVQSLQAQAAALGDLETAIGNNGNSVLAQINKVIKTTNSSIDAHEQTAKWAATAEQRIQAVTQQMQALQTTGIH